MLALMLQFGGDPGDFYKAFESLRIIGVLHYHGPVTAGVHAADIQHFQAHIDLVGRLPGTLDGLANQGRLQVQ